MGRMTGRPQTIAAALGLALAAGLLATPVVDPAAGASPAGSVIDQQRAQHRCRPKPIELSLSADRVWAGGSVVGTIRTSCRSTRRVVVALTGFAGVSVPATVAVRARKRVATFVVTTTSGAPHSGTLTATRRGHTVGATLAIDQPAAPAPPCDPALTGLAVPPHMYNDDLETGTVTLSCRPTSPVTVTLSQEGNEFLLLHPALVPAGASSATFPIDVLDWDLDRRLAAISARLDDVTLVRPVVVDPGLTDANAPPSNVYWNEARPLFVRLSGHAPPEGTVLTMTSSRPDVIPSGNVVVPAGSQWVEWPLTVQQPTQDTSVTLTVALGTASRTTTTLVSLPPEVTGHLLIRQDYPEEPPHSGEEQFSVLVALVDGTVPPRGIYVDLTSDHPEALAARQLWIDPRDGGVSFDWAVGPVAAPTVVTVTGTVVDHPDVTGSFQVLVRPGVDRVEMPDTVVAGVPFTATVWMDGPDDVDQVVWFHPSSAKCTPSEPVLLAGEDHVTSTCVAYPVTEPETGAVMGIWLDRRFNYVYQFTVLPASKPSGRGSASLG